ncbi:MAG: CPBP family intramembrane glutamic endopeptidase, partial [Terracidiphilus sp.]
MRSDAREILTFVALVFAFSCVPYAVILHTGHVGAGPGMVVRLVMWCPALAALATCTMFRLDLSTLGWAWRPAIYEWFGYLLPLVYALPVYVVTWIAIPAAFAFGSFAQQIAATYGLAHAPRLATLMLGIPLIATLGLPLSMANALGEEIGWRGFLLPRLTRQFGFTGGCLVSGVIWALWHFPALLWADYNAGTNPRYALGCFTLMVVGLAFVMGWVRLRSGSLWPCAMLHASHNLMVQAIFDRMTAPVGRALYVTTEFGIGMVCTLGVVAFYFWMRRNELPASSRQLAAETL